MYCCRTCQVVAWKTGHKNECAGYKAAMEHARERMEENTKKQKMLLQLSELLSSGMSYMLHTSDLSSCADLSSCDGLKAIEKLEQAKAMAEEVGNETIEVSGLRPRISRIASSALVRLRRQWSCLSIAS